MYKQTGVRPKELNEVVELPDMFRYVWKDFLALNSARSSNGFGVNPLSYAEIKAYFDLQQQVPEPWEADVIRYFDQQVLTVYADKAKKEQARQKK